MLTSRRLVLGEDTRHGAHHSPESTAKAATTVRQRSEIEEKYKWQLTDIYRSDSEWKADLDKVKGMISQFGAFRGRLAESGEMLHQCLNHRDQTSILFYKLQTYAYLHLDEDNRNSQYQAMTDEVSALGTVYAEAGSFIVPEIMAIDDECLAQMLDQCEELRLYNHHLEDLRRLREHILSEAEEKLLALSGNVARGPSQIFRMIDDADLKFGTLKDEDGNEITLTKQRYYDLLESKERRVRRDAMNIFQEGYKVYLNTLGATLSTSVYKDLFHTKARKYESCLQSVLEGDNIPLETYRNLIDTVDNNLGVLHRYAKLRKKALAVDALRPYDLHIPLVPEARIKITYNEAVETICEALAPLGEDYVGNLRMAFKSGWIDVFETEGKGSGAYSCSTYATHPFVLMNYNNTLDNMFTLAHEMGHALHSYYSKLHQPYVYAGHSIFTAEVASTTNEALLMHFMLKNTTDRERKAYLLSFYIQQIVGTFFTQVMFSNFEDQIHKDVEAGKPLSTDRFRKTFREIYQRFWGEELLLEEYSDISCLRIPHFYRPFYVYQYATSFSASVLIARRILDGDRRQVKSHLEFLCSGESKYPIDTLRAAGVDLTKPDPIEATTELFGKLVDELSDMLMKDGS